MIKWGILSTANIARKALIPAIQLAHNAEVSAISSQSGSQDHIANEFGIEKSYSSYEQLLEDDNIDAVYIPLPNSYHKKWVIAAAKKGKHVLCEKPAALNVKETIEMVEACTKNNVLFMEAFMYQFHPQHTRVKSMISEGVIGAIKLVRSSFSFPIDITSNNIRLNRQLGGGSIYDVGCYPIHASRLILDEEPEQVYVTGMVPEHLGIDTNAQGIISFPNGVQALFDSSFEQPFKNSYEIVGTKGAIEVPFAFRPDANPNGGVVRLKSTNGQVIKEETFVANQYQLQVEHFSDCIFNKKLPSYSAESTIHNMRAIEACYQSLKENRPIKLQSR